MMGPQIGVGEAAKLGAMVVARRSRLRLDLVLVLLVFGGAGKAPLSPLTPRLGGLGDSMYQNDERMDWSGTS